MKKLLFPVLSLLTMSILCAAPSSAKEADVTDRMFYLPEKDGVIQPFVGDCMPYYEDGVSYIYYLKEGGDSFRHSIYLTTTTDFLTYTEYDDPILESSDGPAQDEWIGTGSVVKIDDTYYLFYTGHTDSDIFEYGETILLAKGTDPTSFEKVPEWELTPDESLNQKRDFRDPQAYYDEENGKVVLTVTASQDGTARILKYTLSSDLTESTYDGIIFTDPVGKVYNLECSDTFQIGDTWYLTYSAQDDVLWYAAASQPYGPYSEPESLDGPLYYAAKHVEDGENSYMAGWVRRSGSERDTRKVNEWAGNLLVQQIRQLPDKSLVLEPVEQISGQFRNAVSLDPQDTDLNLSAQNAAKYEEICTIPESFMLKGSFCFEEGGDFGLAFDYDDGEEDYKRITISPDKQELSLQFRGGSVTPAKESVELNAGSVYNFTYIQEDSVGIFYIDDTTAFTVRLYGVTGKPLFLFTEDNTVLFSDLALYDRS